MFFNLKKDIMCRALAKRNRNNPFDYEYAEGFSLEGETDALLNNSYYFSAHDDNMSIFARLGRRVNMDETWFAICLDGKMYSLGQEVFPAGASPLKVEKVDGNWTVSYRGKVNDDDEIVFDARFISKYSPIDFTSNMPAVRMATGIANEKWGRKFFDGLKSISGQCHYEQEGILEGSFSLNGESVEFSMPCVRDHSFGKRDWNYMNNHLWLMAVSHECQFNYSMVSYPSISALEVGNYRDADGMHYMMKADLDFNGIGSGKVPGDLSFRVWLDNGRNMVVTARVLSGITYRFQDGEYILHENIGEFVIDGKTCRGIFEIGFNSDSSRYFNQRDLSRIRR